MMLFGKTLELRTPEGYSCYDNFIDLTSPGHKHTFAMSCVALNRDVAGLMDSTYANPCSTTMAHLEAGWNTTAVQSCETRNYFPMNFNDLPSAMVTLYALMVVNNWFIMMDGYVAAT